MRLPVFTKLACFRENTSLRGVCFRIYIILIIFPYPEPVDQTFLPRLHHIE